MTLPRALNSESPLFRLSSLSRSLNLLSYSATIFSTNTLTPSGRRRQTTMKLNFILSIITSTSLITCEGFTARHDAVHSTTRRKLSPSPTAINASFFGLGVDEKKTNSKVLIEKTKDYIYNKSGFYSEYDSDIYSDEFVFRGPFIGPLNKKDYLQTMDAFGIWKAIPDISPNAWGFSIDPNDPNRVWFMVRNTGTFNGEPIAPDSINYKPNGAKLEGCPETFSIIFDENEKVKHLSVGYVADRFVGNTNGKGAAVGIFNAVGLPFPKVGPLQRFAQWFGTEVVSLGPLSYSVKDVPKWWTDKTIGSEGFL